MSGSEEDLPERNRKMEMSVVLKTNSPIMR